MEDFDVTQAILFRMNERRKNPEQMVELTGSKQFLTIGKENGDNYWTDNLLRKIILKLNLFEARAPEIVKIRTLERMSREQLIELIKPAAAMPTGNVNFWEIEDADD